MPPALQITAVRKRFGNVQALKGVDLTVERGEFFALLGPNGAGKSTLINVIAGLTRADDGDVRVLGHHVVRDYRRSRRAIGIVPQELVYDPFFTVREALRIQAGYFGLGRHNDPWIDELIDALKLGDKRNTNMRALSGGMKRRVLIAQALVHKPEVVVLDEPTAGVDVELRQSLWEFVRRLHRDGHTIVLTTHYLEEAEALCDRIAILNHGEVIALDTTRGLMARGIGNMIRVRVTTAEPVAGLPARYASKIVLQQGTRIDIQLERSGDSVVDVLDAIRNSGATILDLHTEEADLEDVFVELTRSRAS